MKTLQEIFDIVAAHLLTQNQQAREYQGVSYPGGVCRYRSDDGLKCAVGCLIPDDLYVEDMEAAGSLVNFDMLASDEKVHTAPTRRGQAAELIIKALIANGVDIQAETVRSLLFRLQNLHDNEEPRRWHNRLQLLAEEFSLNFNHAEAKCHTSL